MSPETAARADVTLGINPADTVSERFLTYYAQQGYTFLPAGSLLDPATPMTFVGSAGLTQIETGIEHSDERHGERYVLVQPCFRHFDLEKVGRSPVHLSLFEMGGAFAFGKMTREDTLGRIWDFLVTELGFARERLWVTWFSGGKVAEHVFPADAETFQAWQSLGILPEQILAVGPDVGFWKQGAGLTGVERFRKCGPTTEIFFDRGAERRCGSDCRPGCACGRFVEIANILFIHFMMDQETHSVAPLATAFDETVIGVERVAIAQQGKLSVFELETFAPIIQAIRLQQQNEGLPESAAVIADHLRALLFLVADGAPSPGKGGRARIVRLLIRGILTHQQVLGIADPAFIPRLVDVALVHYQDRHPKLGQDRDKLLRYFDREAPRFERTLARGYRELERCISPESASIMKGAQALSLVKNHGMPLPLLEIALTRQGITLDRADYQQAYNLWQQVNIGE